MPYLVEGKCVKKKNADGSAGETVKCHESPEKAKAHMRALYANVKDSDIVEMSLVVTKTSFDKLESDPNRQRRITMVNSDTSPDLYDESMSLELFRDFCDRIENNTPIPEQFKSAVCEDFWCGGMPYISIAHYPAGKDGKNVPGMPESVYVDGKLLKSKAYLYDNMLGKRLFNTLSRDLDMRQKGTANDNPVRVSIGFLDLEHEHIFEGKTVTFTRIERGQICPLCKDGTGSKIYKKGHLVHLAATRVPVNPRTEMSLEEKSMGDIITKKDDAASIVGEDLAGELEAKSLADDVLVVKADVEEKSENVPVEMPFASCYDPNTDSFDQKCINASLESFMVSIRNDMNTVKSMADEVKKSLENYQAKPVVEESMDKEHEMEETPEDEKKEEAKKEESQAVAPSALDIAYASLKSLLGTNPTAEQVQGAFNAFGAEVEKAYTPPATPVQPADIEAIVKSAVESAVKPLAIEIAQLKAGRTTVTQSQQNPVSRALSLRPQELLQKSAASPSRKLTQMEQIARSSVIGKPVDEYGNPVG